MDAPHPDTTASDALARRFYQQELLRELADRRVRFKTDVQRQDFEVLEGATGVAMKPFLHEGKLVAGVTLDDPPEGAEEFDGEVHWKEDVNLFDFEDEIELEESR